MPREVACMPRRILIKSHKPVDEALLEMIKSATGIEAHAYKDACQEGDLVLYSPRNSHPRGDCVKVRIPHLDLLPEILAKASRDWCAFTKDPEAFYYNHIIEAAESLYRDYRTAWDRGPRIPLKPPPILVASEVYVEKDNNAYEEALRRVSEGANIIVLGATRATGREEYQRLVKKLSIDYTVFVDQIGLLDPEEAYSLGAEGWMSLTPNQLSAITEDARSLLAYVIIPSSLGSAHSRYRQLSQAYTTARRLGYDKIILDPVLQPPVAPGALEGLYAAKLLSYEGLGPIMLGINNVYELVDADTHASIGVLTALAGEAGASLILVGEESSKARGATLEAVIASRLASLSLKYNSPPKDYPYRLLQVKSKGRNLTI